jgi:hypothetical protein
MSNIASAEDFVLFEIRRRDAKFSAKLRFVYRFFSLSLAQCSLSARANA